MLAIIEFVPHAALTAAWPLAIIGKFGVAVPLESFCPIIRVESSGVDVFAFGLTWKNTPGVRLDWG
jgi:hypothetical protein